MYRGSRSKTLLLLVGGDLVILLGAYFLGLQYWWLKTGPAGEDFIFSAVVSLSVYLLALTMFDLYEIWGNSLTAQTSTLAPIVGAVLSAGIGLSGLFYLLPAVKFPRGVFLIQMGLAIPLLFLWRVGFWRLRQEMLVPKRVLIVGAGEAGRTALELLELFGSEFKVVGFIEDRPWKPSRVIGGHAVLGGAEDLPALVREHQVDGLIMTMAGVERDPLIGATLRCRMRGTFVYDLLTLGEQGAGKVLLKHVRDSWFVYAPGFLILHNRMFQRIKRMTDVSCAVAGLVLASPLLLVSIVLLALEAHGPVFFRQARVGQDEQLFSALKLRTMEWGTEAQSPYTKSHDPRVTRIGRVLRFLRLDEIPQMWNVLKGEMSFIGPRAEWDILAKEYKEKIPYYSLRHVVKPGITGWAQVNYPYGSSVEDAYKKLEYDLYYVKNMSLALDLKILLKSVSVVLLGKGVR